MRVCAYLSRPRGGVAGRSNAALFVTARALLAWAAEAGRAGERLPERQVQTSGEASSEGEDRCVVSPPLLLRSSAPAPQAKPVPLLSGVMLAFSGVLAYSGGFLRYSL